jgi:hypothetical protein
MKDEELNLEETDHSHTLGGAIIYTYIHQSRWGIRRAGYVPWTDTPPWMCEREVRGRRGSGFVRVIRYTWIHQSRRLSHWTGCVPFYL